MIIETMHDNIVYFFDLPECLCIIIINITEKPAIDDKYNLDKLLFNENTLLDSTPLKNK